MAAIFTSKDDDVRKVMGYLTRLADGNGLESDSGVKDIENIVILSLPG